MTHEEKPLMGYTPFNPWDTNPLKLLDKSAVRISQDALCLIPQRNDYSLGVGYSEYRSDAKGQKAPENHPFDKSDKCARASLLHAFRLGDLANQLNALMTFFYAPYAWSRINYCLCTDGRFGFGIEGSVVPSHQIYIDGTKATEKLGKPVADAPELSTTDMTGFGHKPGFPVWAAGPEELIQFIRTGAGNLGKARDSYVSPLQKWPAGIVKQEEVTQTH